MTTMGTQQSITINVSIPLTVIAEEFTVMSSKGVAVDGPFFVVAGLVGRRRGRLAGEVLVRVVDAIGVKVHGEWGGSNSWCCE